MGRLDSHTRQHDAKFHTAQRHVPLRIPIFIGHSQRGPLGRALLVGPSQGLGSQLDFAEHDRFIHEMADLRQDRRDIDLPIDLTHQVRSAPHPIEFLGDRVELVNHGLRPHRLVFPARHVRGNARGPVRRSQIERHHDQKDRRQCDVLLAHQGMASLAVLVPFGEKIEVFHRGSPSSTGSAWAACVSSDTEFPQPFRLSPTASARSAEVPAKLSSIFP